MLERKWVFNNKAEGCGVNIAKTSLPIFLMPTFYCTGITIIDISACIRVSINVEHLSSTLGSMVFYCIENFDIVPVSKYICKSVISHF